MEDNKLVIFGAGAVGRLALEIAKEKYWEVEGFVVESGYDSSIPGYPAFTDVPDTANTVIAIGEPSVRARIASQYERFATLVHSSVWRGNNTSIGEGSIICAGVRIDPDVRIGKHVIVSSGCVISHDCVIGDYVTLAPGVNLAGGVTVEEGCKLGIGSTFAPSVTIGSWSVVGAGSVVINDVRPKTTVAGVPARELGIPRAVSEQLEQSIKYREWIPVRSPGLKFYAEEIMANRPFSLLRYGEGEWRVIHPDMHIKKNNVYSEWRDEAAQDRLRNTLLNAYNHPRYWPCIWHQRYFAKDGRLQKIQRWLKQNRVDVPWHDGRLWRRGTEQRELHTIIRALRKAPLPLVIVGPKEVGAITERLPVHAFITVHRTHAYNKIEEIKHAILSKALPGAVVAFSVGGTANILIHELFPLLGEKCFLIDFGATWEGLVGMKTRPYHKKMKTADIHKNWEGK